MKFFEKQRVQVFFHGGKLVRNTKTAIRSWRINLVIAMKAEEILSCEEIVCRNYEALETRDNWIEEIKIAKEFPDQIVSFFGLADHTAPVLTLSECTLTDLRMTRVDGCSELWVKIEHPNSDALHTFVREYAFQRFWAEFAAAQPSLLDVPQARNVTVVTQMRKVN